MKLCLYYQQQINSGGGRYRLIMEKYRCRICGYVYDPNLGDADGNIKVGTAFTALPDSWLCPICGATKAEFDKLDEMV